MLPALIIMMMILAAAGGCWLLLVADGCRWQLAVAGGGFCPLPPFPTHCLPSPPIASFEHYVCWNETALALTLKVLECWLLNAGGCSILPIAKGKHA